MILETIDECDLCADGCICVSMFHYKLLVDNDESAIIKIITQDTMFGMYMTKVHT